MKKLLVVVVVGVLLGIGLLGPVSRAAAQYERGKVLYDDKCQLCHGLKGDGKGPAAVSFNPKPANFTDPRFWPENSDRKIATTIRKGRGPMPAFDLKPEEIKAIIDYMSHAFKKVGK